MMPTDGDEGPAAWAGPSAKDQANQPALDQLATVYRNFPGLRSLIVRRVQDPEVAADILQDAAVTTLEKLKAGEISHPENIGGYLYRVALNHLRNHHRKSQRRRSDSVALDELADRDHEPEWHVADRPQWARTARQLLQELPTPRDRQLLVRFYLNDENKSEICRDLRLSDVHFNRVIYRARTRFRQLLEDRGLHGADFLSVLALASWLAFATTVGPVPTTSLPVRASPSSVSVSATPCST